MKKKHLFFIMLISIVLFISGCSSQPGFYDNNAITGKDVLTQTEDEYLVYFYQPNCSHCVEFKPTLEQYEQQENALTLYKIDASKPSEKSTWEEYNIKGTPTILHIKKMDNGEVKVVAELLGVKELEEIPTKE